MHLALVIPALNEEDAIAGTLRRSLAARAKVQAHTAVTQMTIVFVNDGCTDRTQEIVDQPEFAEVVKVNYGRNRGYGAAIKAGWQATDADLLGFMDADGTCDPDDCVRLVQQLLAKNADVALAARTGGNTKMPPLRQFGNRIFATLLGVVSGQMQITDSASGFRIVRRSSLSLLFPLPNGLHFTPAMSSICLLDPRLSIVEVPVAYEERIGRSKLSVIRDGFRFLWTILLSACLHIPIKVALASSVAAALAFMPAVLWAGAHGRSGTAWLTAGMGILFVMLLIACGVIIHQLNFVLIGPRRKVGSGERLLQELLEYRRLILSGTATAIVGCAGLLASTAGAGLQPALALVCCVVATAGMLALMGGLVVHTVRCVQWKVEALSGHAILETSPQLPSSEVNGSVERRAQAELPHDVIEPHDAPVRGELEPAR